MKSLDQRVASVETATDYIRQRVDETREEVTKVGDEVRKLNDGVNELRTTIEVIRDRPTCASPSSCIELGGRVSALERTEQRRNATMRTLWVLATIAGTVIGWIISVVTGFFSHNAQAR